MKLLPLLFAAMMAVSAKSQTISTIAGNGTAGSTGNGGPATAATLDEPGGLSFDKFGDLLICHTNHIRKVNSVGVISNAAGSDTSTNSGGGNDGGPATCAFLFEPYHVVSDVLNNYYIADYWYGEVRKVTQATGIITKIAGTGWVGSSGDGGPATDALFKGLSCVAIDTLRNCLYISDGFNYKVRKMDLATGILTRYAGTGVNGYSGDGGQATAAAVSRVFGLCLDKAGNLYVGDRDNGRIRKIDVSTGIISTYAGNGVVGYGGDGGPATNAQISKTTALCRDGAGNLFFTDEDNNRVRRIDSLTGIITTVAGNGTAGFSGDGGPATNAQFNHPTGIALDGNGNLFVSDFYNERVRKITNVGHNMVGVKVISVEKQTLIYPNPISKSLHIDNVNRPTVYTLKSITGTTVQQGVLKDGANSIITEILDEGMYILELVNEEERQVVKVVKR